MYLKGPSQPPPFFDAIEIIDITWCNEILLFYYKLCSWKCVSLSLVVKEWFSSSWQAPNLNIIAKLSHVNKNKGVAD